MKEGEFKLCRELTKRDVDYLTSLVWMIDKICGGEKDLELATALATMHGYLIGSELLPIDTRQVVADPEFYGFVMQKIREFDGKYAQLN